eukprot:TRINITY_DN683_c0_g4_i1.p1 TRINITY_DN683_c0_g4~~TRINITY_DN683_c0_g4_i1.p1  ORF type:complete len:825 (+),score=171.79 TRINITY_DN683_c0_g4_i1:793-3267(+)
MLALLLSRSRNCSSHVSLTPPRKSNPSSPTYSLLHTHSIFLTIFSSASSFLPPPSSSSPHLPFFFVSSLPPLPFLPNSLRMHAHVLLCSRLVRGLSLQPLPSVPSLPLPRRISRSLPTSSSHRSFSTSLPSYTLPSISTLFPSPTSLLHSFTLSPSDASLYTSSPASSMSPSMEFPSLLTYSRASLVGESGDNGNGGDGRGRGSSSRTTMQHFLVAGLALLTTAAASLTVDKSDAAEESTLPTEDVSTFTSDPPEAPKERLVTWWQIISPDLMIFTVSVLAAFAAAVCRIYLQRLVGTVIDQARLGKSLLAPAARFAAFILLESVTAFSYYALVSVGCERMAARLRQRVYDSILQQDIAFFDTMNSGEMLARVSSDVVEIRRAVKYMLTDGVRNTTQLLGGMVSMYSISPSLTSVMLVAVPVIVFIGSYFGRYLRSLSRRAQDARAVSIAISGEVIQNMRTVRSFANETLESERYKNVNDAELEASVWFGVSLGLFSSLTQIAVNGIALAVISTQSLSPGELTAYLVTSLGVQRSLGKLSVLSGKVMQGYSSFDRVKGVSGILPSIPLRVGAKLHRVLGHFEFEKVNFSYPSRPGHVVFQNLNLDIKPGKVLSLVGHSGSGKSTVSSLIQRFYDPDGGNIYLDGINVKDLDPTWLRQQIGVVSQEPTLFQTTILENLRYGFPAATEEEVIAASIKANCHQFISQFPSGYMTMVGERGVQLSGGQKQRVAIARAILRDPKILILDEATSALDAGSEQQVQNALSTLMKGRTVIVIAHRLSTIRDSDSIVVLSEGDMIEEGTHDELMGSSAGVYRTLVEKQFTEKQ